MQYDLCDVWGIYGNESQELASLRNIPDAFRRIVIVSGSKKPWINEEGFLIMGMKRFLLNPDSLEY